MAAHPFVHIELSATDPGASAKFYADVFDWKIEHDPNFDYYMWPAEGGPGGGFVKAGEHSYKQGDVIAYIDSDDIDATLKKIESRGGKTLQPKTEIQGIGWFAFFTDPGGNRIGLFSQKRAS